MPSSPYKSRLFTLIVRRSNRLKDRLGSATRQARATLSLGFQIVLYPVYLLVQTARMAGNKLGQAVQKQLSPVAETPTAPIERLFATITDGEIPLTGIATDLESRDLQFVVGENETRAIADEISRQHLQKQIQTVLANYYYDRRQYDRLTRKSLSLPPTFAKTKTKILPPIRWFWEMIRWEQTGPVALSIDLFGESSLVPTRPAPADLPPIPPPPITITPILQAIDRRLAELEIQSLATVPETDRSLVTSDPAVIETIPETSPTDTEQSRARRLYRLIYEAIDHFFPTSGTALDESTETLSLPETATLTLRENMALPQPAGEGLSRDTEEDPFTIAKLIQAAIDHFFAPPPIDSLPVMDDDPWLDVADLFATEERSPEDPPTNTDPVPPRLSPTAPRPTPTRQNTNQKISQESRPKSIQKVTKSVAAIQARQANPTEITPPEPPKETRPTVFPLPDRQPAALDRSEPIEEEWWETRSTPIGYEKHPLERILQWLDTIILWIEELIIQIWRWFRSRRRRSKHRGRRRE